MILLFLYLFQYTGCTGGQVELEPTLVVASQSLVKDGVVNHLVVVESIAAESGIVCIEKVLVGTRFHHEAITGIGVARAEVKEEEEIATTEGKHLVAIVVPDFHDILLLEASVLLEHLQHSSIEITKVVEA